jgi:hypothetical protein
VDINYYEITGIMKSWSSHILEKIDNMTLRVNGIRWLALAFLWSGFAFAAGIPANKVTSINRTPQGPVIDGVLNEAEWAGAVIVDDLHQTDPVEYAEPSERTEFLLQYDDDALYIGVRAFDRNPSKIAAKVLRQGGRLRPDDRIRIVLDPFNDKRSGFIFVVNPNGVRLDGIYKGPNIDMEWSGIWQAEAAIVADGWVAEIRFPFKTLSFNQDSDWGLNFSRKIMSSQQDVAWSSRNQQFGPSVAGTMTGIRGVSQGLGLDIVPSISAVSSRTYEGASSDSDIEPSLDIFYKITSGLNGSLTFNTDFSATEVDGRQVNLTRFNLFFPEKRSFFLRESDIFEFGGIGGEVRNSTVPRPGRENGRPYFSRRIGLSADGEPVSLDVGGKLSGRIGRWNVGTMLIQQAEFEDIDATLIAVARATVNLFEESNLGFILTSGDPESNFDNTLIGVDYRYTNSRLSNGRRLDADFWYQQSDTEGVSGDNAAFGMQISAPNRLGWRGSMAAKEIQQNFDPAIGFVSRSGVRQYFGDVGYTYQVQGNLLRTVFAGVDGQQSTEIGGDLQSQRVIFRLLELRTNSTDEAKLWYQQRKENLREPFEISEGVIIPVGDYSFDSWRVEVMSSPDRVLNATLSIEDGDFFDGNKLTFTSDVRWRPSKHFHMGVTYRVDDVELPQGDFSTRLASADTIIAFSNTISWVNLLQYDNISDTVGINSRLHWVPEAGRNIYFVIDHNFVERLSDSNFHSETTDVTFKIDYTFRF